MFHHSRTLYSITQGHATIDIRNNREQTPLLLAVSQGHVAIMEALVMRGADISAEDEDGDTCLHLGLARTTPAPDTETSSALQHVSTDAVFVKLMLNTCLT